MRKAPKTKRTRVADAPTPREARPGWLTAFAAHWEKLVGALLVGLAATVGVWLEPLKDYVLHKLYAERAELALLPDKKELLPGEAVTVRVRLSPGSEIDLADGVVKLQFDPEQVSLAPGSQESFNIKRSNQARIVDEGVFVLFARNHKDAVETRLHATLTTKYASHVAPEVALKLQAPPQDNPMPFIERSGSKAINVSGTWRIQVGVLQGSMKVRQDVRNDVAGEYRFSGKDATAFPVSGYKDGTSFKVFYLRNVRDTQRWFVDANFALNSEDPRFIEMKGCAFSILQDPNVTRDSPVAQGSSCVKRDFVGWRGDGASTFYATAQMR